MKQLLLSYKAVRLGVSAIILCVIPAFAQPYGFLTPVPVNSYLRTISVGTKQQLRSYPLPQPGLVLGLAVNSSGNILYTANNMTAASGAEIVVSALPSGTENAVIPLTFTPSSMLLSPDGASLYVAGTIDYTSAFLSIIDTASNTVSATLTLKINPDPSATFPMAITPDGSTLYLAAGGLVRLKTADRSVSVYSSPGSFSQGIAVTPDGSRLWFSLNNTIQVRDAKTLALINSISASGSSFGGNGLFITPDGSLAILANNGLRAFDTTTFQLTVSNTSPPFAGLGYLTPGPDANSFLVTSTVESLVLRVDHSLKLLNTYIQSGAATGSLALPGGKEILAANGNVTAVGTVNSSNGALGPSIAVGCQAGIPAINSARTHLYIPDRCSQDITVLSFISRPIERLLHNSVFATKALVDPAESRVYAADLSGIKYPAAGTIEILNASTGSPIRSLTGALTIDIALSADGSRLYVVDNGSSGTGFDCPIGGICAFDTSTFALLAQIPNVFGPLALSQDGRSLYVGPGGSSVTAMDTLNFSVSTIDLPVSLSSFGFIAMSPVGNSAVIIGNSSSGGVGFCWTPALTRLPGSFQCLPPY